MLICPLGHPRSEQAPTREKTPPDVLSNDEIQLDNIYERILQRLRGGKRCFKPPRESQACSDREHFT